MDCFELSLVPAETQDDSGFMSGTPSLPADSDWPTCRMCSDKLVHFIDLKLPKESSPFKPGSRLQVFACRQHDDISGTIYSDYRRFAALGKSKRLPHAYWEINDGHYLLRLLPPGAAVKRAEAEKRLALRNLELAKKEDSEAEPLMAMKLFGYPSWAQDPEEHQCSCGAPMRLLLQIPEGTGFDMAAEAPQQPNSFSSSKYCLFLSNELYLMGCAAQCHPMALLPVLQGT
jgi:hypothetical protein